MKQLFTLVITAVLFTGLGLLLAGTDAGEQLKESASASIASTRQTVARKALEQGYVDARMAMIMADEELMATVQERGGFGGKFSRHAAQNMFSRSPEAIADVEAQTDVEPIGDRAWLIRMPIVNAVLFETDEGLVLVDTGMGPAGPAIVKAIKSVSDKPLHTIIYTHGHVDHAYGTWALMEQGWNPQIIAHEAIMPRFERYVLLPGSLSQYMSQPEEQLPHSLDDIVLPTRLFNDRLELEIGGETFVLQHHKGETDDQLYVWLPDRKMLATADYYQGFLPNAGNGKRAQRHVKEWIVALREMAALNAEFVLPAHGDAITDPARIESELLMLAEAFEYIWEHTIDGLNKGLRKDQIAESATLPPHLINEHSLREHYVTYKDVSKMIMKRYTGWWDDLPSHWTPSTPEARAAIIVAMAGGVEQLDARARALQQTDLVMATHLAEWAWLAEPDNPIAQQLLLDIFRTRVLDDNTMTQETLAFLDMMTEAMLKKMETQ